MIDFNDEAIENMKRNAAYVTGYQNTVDEVELHGIAKVRKIIENEVASSDDLYWEEYKQGREDALKDLWKLSIDKPYRICKDDRKY